MAKPKVERHKKEWRNRKVNKMTKVQLKKRIDELGESQSTSKYYQHLYQRLVNSY